MRYDVVWLLGDYIPVDSMNLTSVLLICIDTDHVLIIPIQKDTSIFQRKTHSDRTTHFVRYGWTKQSQRVLRKRVERHVNLHLLWEVSLLFSYVPKCLLPFSSAPFNRQSSKSCFNYEPCLFPCADPIRTNKRVFSAIMGLSIGWQPRTEILCIFVYIYLYIYMRVYVSVCFCCGCR